MSAVTEPAAQAQEPDERRGTPRPINTGPSQAQGMARFACRINRPMWEAIKVLVDAHFAKSEKPQ